MLLVDVQALHLDLRWSEATKTKIQRKSKLIKNNNTTVMSPEMHTQNQSFDSVLTGCNPVCLSMGNLSGSTSRIVKLLRLWVRFMK